MRLIWRVASVPVGRYRSFERRGWPSADFEDGRIAAALYCEDEYRPADVKAGKHGAVTIRVADHSVTPWQWRTLKAATASLAGAKRLAAAFFEAHPEMAGKADV